MSIDVCIQSENANGVRGDLVINRGEVLIYSNHTTIAPSGEVGSIPVGQSYELVTEDDIVTLPFETSEGALNGLNTKMLIDLAIHREEALLQRQHSPEKALLLIRLKNLSEFIQRGEYE